MDQERGLPGYGVDADTGKSWGWARGVGLSMMLCHAHELWPDVAAHWYEEYSRQYWQDRGGPSPNIA